MTIHQCLVLLASIIKLQGYEQGNHRAKVEVAMHEKRGIQKLIHSTPAEW